MVFSSAGLAMRWVREMPLTDRAQSAADWIVAKLKSSFKASFGTIWRYL